jgi:hypothetical protein
VPLDLPDDQLALFPRSQFLDGTLSDADARRLDDALARFLREDPAGLARSLGRLSGFQPLEFYEGVASVCDQIVQFLNPAYASREAVPYPAFREYVGAIWGTAMGFWAARKNAKSILEGLR